MLAFVIVAAAAATATVANKIELAGMDGATGLAAGVPATTANAQALTAPEYAWSSILATTKSTRGFDTSAAVTVTVVKPRFSTIYGPW